MKKESALRKLKKKLSIQTERNFFRSFLDITVGSFTVVMNPLG